MQRTRNSKNLAATTRDMRYIAREAHKRNLNRRMKAAQFKLLDPKGTHILSPNFMHDRADGKLVEPHMRCHVHMKLLGKQKAVELLMDVPMQFLAGYLTEEEIAEMIEKGKSLRAMEQEEGDSEPITDTMQKKLMDLNELAEPVEATPNADNMSAEELMIGLDELGEATRNADAMAEEHGLEGWAELAKVDPEALQYVAAQRAIRAAMIMDGQDPTKLSRTEKTTVNLSESVQRLLPHLTALAMDGIAIGLTARQDA